MNDLLPGCASRRNRFRECEFYNFGYATPCLTCTSCPVFKLLRVTNSKQYKLPRVALHSYRYAYFFIFRIFIRKCFTQL